MNGVYGIPAAGIAVRLDQAVNGTWIELSHCVTGEDGRLDRCQLELDKSGTYRLEFDTDSYFVSLGVTPFYAAVTVEFRIPDPGYPYRVWLLLTPSSYLAHWQR
jgi:5-hydroxyisourate hydrolase